MLEQEITEEAQRVVQQAKELREKELERKRLAEQEVTSHTHTHTSTLLTPSAGERVLNVQLADFFKSLS